MNITKAGLFFLALTLEIVIGYVCIHFRIGTVTQGLTTSSAAPGAFSSWTYVIQAATFSLGTATGSLVTIALWVVTVMVIWSALELVASFVP